MSVNTAIDYLINNTPTIDAYSETLPLEGIAVVYRVLPSTTVKKLSGRSYSTYSFNAIVRGEKDSTALLNICQSIVEALDLSTDSNIVQCNVTTEPNYAFKDDNGNLHYTFNVDVLV